MPGRQSVPAPVNECPAAGRWNHNIHYGLELLRAVPASASVALDVGCGEGWLVRELSRVVGHVIGLDPDEESIANARSYSWPDGVEYILGDFLTHPFEAASFDLITSVAALHHMDEEAALRRMAGLLRPSGTLAVVGLGGEAVCRPTSHGSLLERSRPGSQADQDLLGDAGSQGLAPSAFLRRAPAHIRLGATGQALPETGHVALCHHVDQAGHWTTLTPPRLSVMASSFLTGPHLALRRKSVRARSILALIAER